MKTDLIGIDNVAAWMKQCKLTKFRITKFGASHRNTDPLIETSNEKSTNSQAIEEFKEWATYTDNSNPYEIEVYNNLEECIENDIDTNKKKGTRKRLSFVLNKERDFIPANQQQNNNNISVADAIEHALLKFQTKQNENILIQRLEAMEAKINSINSEDDFEDDEESLSGINNPNMTALIGMLTQLFNKKGAAVNGTYDEPKIQNSKSDNIKKAIAILSKHNDQIDTDLLKLANLAENNNGTFNLLLNSLRSM